MYLMQVPNWAWAMYRRSWTAYPAGRRTPTCPMPTTRLPPTARTHEDQHTSPCSPSLFPPPPPPQPSSISLVPPPSTLTLHSITTVWGEREVQGRKRRSGHSFASPLSFHFLLTPHSPPPLSLSCPPGCFAEGQYLSLLHTRLSVTPE